MKKLRKLGSVQRSFVGMRAVRRHVVCLATGMPGVYDYVSVLQVDGISYDLKSEEEQRLINELYQAVLRSLPYAVQIMWRVLPLQLGEYLSHFSLGLLPEALGSDEFPGSLAEHETSEHEV